MHGHIDKLKRMRESKIMLDINRWFMCNEEQPKNKGRYLLMVGIRDKQSGYLNIGIIESNWNGHEWAVADNHICYKWKYMKPDEIKKYPDFIKNNRRVKL